MIERPTVFILGAGASMPYGMPSGAELRHVLCGASFGPNGSRSHLLKKTFQVDLDETAYFAKTFLKSGQLSIDAFLARQEGFTEIGKLCIAAELCSRENPGDVFGIVEDHWYSLLLEAMTRDAKTIYDVRKNQLRVITFNYDRSLEYFLYETLKNSYPASDADVLTTTGSLGILHVYGCLGEFNPEPRPGARQYSTTVSADSLRIAANGIRVIPEARDNDPVFDQAREMLLWSEAICFLGFGFDFLNLARLRVPAVLKEMRKRPRMLASVYQKTTEEVAAYRQRICPDQNWATFDEKNVMTLRQSGILL